MNPQSAKALTWTAGILAVLAPAVISPSGSFPLLLLAALCAAIPSVFAARRTRAIAMILLIVAIALATSSYPAFVRDQDAYRQHAQDHAAKPQSVTPVGGQAK